MIDKVAYVCAAILVVLLGLYALSIFGFIPSHNPNVFELAVEVAQSAFLIYIGLNHSRKLESLENKVGSLENKQGP